jgi:glycosyltransferase involved in cell wall biosynthesis
MNQSTKPSVCAIMLTANRPAMAKQAVESFRRQTYQNKRLLIYETGSDECAFGCGPMIYSVQAEFPTRPTIGELRNNAVGFRSEYGHNESEIIVHWDDDDLSHPNRIAEQVALLQSSGADCVGYSEMLFWRVPTHVEIDWDNSRQTHNGEAWIYRNPDPSYALGTSLCYWRKTWERKPFQATSQGEDHLFCAGLKVAATSSLPQRTSQLIGMPEPPPGNDPRMIARIHPGNTSSAYRPGAMEAEARRPGGFWKRVSAWDEYCSEVFAK